MDRVSCNQLCTGGSFQHNTSEILHNRSVPNAGLIFRIVVTDRLQDDPFMLHSVFLDSTRFTRYDEFVHKIGTGGLKACALLIWSSRNQEPGCCFSLHIILLLTEFSST